MKTYTVHEPPSVPWTSVEERAARLELVPDKFSFWAVLFGPLWLLWNRMWLETLGFVALIAAGYGVLWLLNANEDAVGLLPALLGIALGFVGNDLRRAALARRGYSETQSISGASYGECELKALERLAAGSPA